MQPSPPAAIKVAGQRIRAPSCLACSISQSLATLPWTTAFSQRIYYCSHSSCSLWRNARLQHPVASTARNSARWDAAPARSMANEATTLVEDLSMAKKSALGSLKLARWVQNILISVLLKLLRIQNSSEYGINYFAPVKNPFYTVLLAARILLSIQIHIFLNPPLNTVVRYDCTIPSRAVLTTLMFDNLEYSIKLKYHL